MREPLIVVFDIETQKTADEVGGWKNIPDMRVALAVAHSSLDGFMTFSEETVDDLIALLKEANLIVGFNQLGFDYKVLSAYSDYDFKALPNLDILAEIRKATGRLLGLDHIAGITLNKGKTGNGLDAVRWFKEGDFAKVEAYCRDDVVVTKDLYEFGLKYGYLLHRYGGKLTQFSVSWWEKSI